MFEGFTYKLNYVANTLPVLRLLQPLGETVCNESIYPLDQAACQGIRDAGIDNRVIYERNNLRNEIGELMQLKLPPLPNLHKNIERQK